MPSEYPPSTLKVRADCHRPQVKLREFVMPDRVRRLPPARFPSGAASLLRAGDVAELYYQDGWWEVAVESVADAASKSRGGSRGKRRRGGAAKKTAGRPPPTVEVDDIDDDDDDDDSDDDSDGEAGAAGPPKKDAKRFHVRSTEYNAQHTVSEGMLRPKWLWSNERRVWRYELACGHGCVPLEGHGRPSFKFAGGLLRAYNANAVKAEAPP